MHVVKVGGSILKDERDLVLIKNKVKDCNKCIIVTSALRNVTNNLIEAITTKNTIIIDTIFDMHEKLLRNYYNEFVFDRLSEYREDLFHLLLGHINEEKRDLILSYGEKMATLVLYAFFKKNGFDVDYIINPVIVTDSNFGDASYLYKETEANMEKLDLGHDITIVPGFIGITLGNKVTTLGRGGSDYTATIFGRFFEADVRLITDVPGVMTSDPKIFKNSKTLPEISINEALKMSYFRVKNFNYKTFTPVLDADINITVESLYGDEKTLITRNKINSVKCIALTGFAEKNMLVFIGHGMSDSYISKNIIDNIGKNHLYHRDDLSLSVLVDEDIVKNKRCFEEAPLWIG